MTAPNHALTGAIIGLTISDPYIALPLAFLSHFVCDAIPHYDSPGDGGENDHGRRFIMEQLVGGAILCFLLVVCLVLARPTHWLAAAICAFLAASPDLFWIPRFIRELRTGKNHPPKWWLLRFHAWIQWKTGPGLWWVEAIWFVLCGTFVASRL